MNRQKCSLGIFVGILLLICVLLFGLSTLSPKLSPRSTTKPVSALTIKDVFDEKTKDEPDDELLVFDFSDTISDNGATFEYPEVPSVSDIDGHPLSISYRITESTLADLPAFDESTNGKPWITVNGTMLTRNHNGNADMAMTPYSYQRALLPYFQHIHKYVQKTRRPVELYIELHYENPTDTMPDIISITVRSNDAKGNSVAVGKKIYNYTPNKSLNRKKGTFNE